MGFAVSGPAAYKRTGPGGEPRVDHVDVKRDGVSTWGSRGNSYGIFNTRAHAAAVYVAHRKEVIPKGQAFYLRPLTGIDVPCTHVSQIFGTKLRRKARQLDKIFVTMS